MQLLDKSEMMNTVASVVMDRKTDLKGRKRILSVTPAGDMQN
jgi:hypothetical protein